MTRMRVRHWLMMVIVTMVFCGGVQPIQAHQPYCEQDDGENDAPFRIADPTVSMAYYAALFPRDDVDYLTFHGEAGQQILLGLTIPQIDGQEDFAPTFALFGPGLGQSDVSLLPERVQLPRDASFELFRAGDEEPEAFYEPFSGTSYWSRQETRVTLPETGRYTVAVWHDQEMAGRYVMVVGDREVIGGDVGCLMSLGEYFTPIDPDVASEHTCDAHDFD